MSAPPKDPMQRKRFALWPLLFVIILMILLWLRRPEPTPVGSDAELKLSQPAAAQSEIQLQD